MSVNRKQTDDTNALWNKAYNHFRDRLNERYGIDISFKEYVLLTKERIGKIKYTGKNKVIGWLKIRGEMVVVAKEVKRNRILCTVLPLEAAKISKPFMDK